MSDYSNTARVFAPVNEQDDPLAELARIVSGTSDRQFAPVKMAEVSASAKPTRHVPLPSFDLEDALMAELGMGAMQQPQSGVRAPVQALKGDVPATKTPEKPVEAATVFSLEDQLLAELGFADAARGANPAINSASNKFQPDEMVSPSFVEEQADNYDDLADLLSAESNRQPEEFGSNFSDELFGIDRPVQHGVSNAANEEIFESFGEIDLDLGAAFEAEMTRSQAVPANFRPQHSPEPLPEMASFTAPTAAPVARSLATPTVPAEIRTPPRRLELTERELDDQFAAAFAEELDIGLSQTDDAYDDTFDAAPAQAVSEFAPQEWAEDDYAEFEDQLAMPATGQAQPMAKSQPAPMNRAQASGVATVPQNSGDPAEWDMAYGDLGYADDGEFDEGQAGQTRDILNRRGFTFAALALTCALFVGGGALAFGYISGPSAGTAEPVVVKADASPVKIKPENPGGALVPNQDQAAYDKVAGQPKDGEAQANLVSQTEKPVDMAALVEAPAQAPLAEAKAEERLAPSTEGDAPAIPALAPRKVKTMVIKPDGTVVAAEDAPVAAGTQAADAQSNVTALVPIAQDARDAAGAALLPIDAEEAPADALVTRSLGGAEANVAETAPQEIAQAPALADPAPITKETAKTASVEQPAADIGGEWAVQLASQRSAEDAQATFQNLKRKFPSVLDGKALAVQRAEVSGKGVFYRVRIPAQSKEEAAELCERLKAAGGSCFIAR